MFDYKSDYALNKRSLNIVYRLADGSCVEIGPEDCPDFEQWKLLSDADYHQQELHGQRTTRRNIPLDESIAGCVDDLFENSDEHTLEEAMDILEQCLTETQRRRYLLHTHDGLTMRQIAALEQVNPMVVQRSIAAARRKIKIFLQKSQKWGYKTAEK